jgi:hypothetical protein
MAYICPAINCKKEFTYISELKRHLNKSYHCGKEITDIDVYILQKKKSKSISGKTCIHCNTIYSKKSCLDRHIKNSKCSVENKELKRQQQIEDLKNEIEKLKSQLNTQILVKQPLKTTVMNPVMNPVMHPVKKIDKKTDKKTDKKSVKQAVHLPVQSTHLPEQIVNQPAHLPEIEEHIVQTPVPHQTQTINNISNNLTINNNNITIIQHINPAGFETLPEKLDETEMLRLLNLEDKGVIEIVKLVCEQEENKNFYKLNMNKNNISYLNNNYKIDICQDKELKDKLLKQCVILTYRMLIICSSLMTSEQIYRINSNLQNISQKMKEEIFDNGLKNIIEYELRNNSKLTKDRISKYTKELINNQEIKEQALNNYNRVLQIKEDTYKNKNPNISLYDINNKLGDPMTSKDLEREFTFNEFNTKLYDYTTYKKYWSKRIRDELRFINTHPNKTIGDLTNFENRKKDIIESMEKMSIINFQMREYDENNNLLVTYDNFRVEVPDIYIRENRRIKE